MARTEDRTDAALAALRQIDPQRATPDDLRRCEEVLAALDPAAQLGAWLEAQAILAAFLLESREGDRAGNVARATGIYRRILESPAARACPGAWDVAVCGYANCLVSQPDAPVASFEHALGLLNDLLARLRQANDGPRLATALSCYANLLKMSPGDPDDNLARAIAATREEIQALGTPERDRIRWGRAHHNLAALFMAQRVVPLSQKVDDAVRALRIALACRSREADPAGRARTLRALAQVLPYWSGADSQAQANAMAEACRQEAEDIAAENPDAAPRDASWGRFGASQQSALNVDLDPYLALPPPEAVSQLEQAIANHRAVIGQLSRERDPMLWADWKGGLGKLLARLAHVEQRPETINARVNEAYGHLREAVEAADPASQPRLCRDLHRTMGELGHQFGIWPLSHQGYAAALALSDQLFDEAAAPESQRQELVEMRGFAQFAAYGALRDGKLDEAVRLAELGRARSSIETLAATALRASAAPAEVRDAVAAARARVSALEAQLRALREKDPRAVAQTLERRLAGQLGVPLGTLKMRVTDPGNLTEDTSAESLSLTSQLRDARNALRQALAAAHTGEQRRAPFGADDVRAVAASLGCPLLYLMATVHGAACLAVLPSGEIDPIELEGVTSDVTMQLVHGSGYLDGALRGDVGTLAQSLPGVLTMLADRIVGPVAQRLARDRYARAVVVPLGSIGLLPLQAAAPDGMALGFAPSARALQTSLALRSQRASAKPALSALAFPARPSFDPLPLAVSEARSIAAMPGRWSATTVLVRGEADLAGALRALEGATHLHFACHAQFQPLEPLESALLLSGSDSISLADLMGGKVRLNAARTAVLCACQTAATESQEIPDEALGLPMGLLLAGVPHVVGTLWPVADRAGTLFSVRFYERLDACGDPLQAAADTQRWLRDANVADVLDYVTRMQGALLPGDTDAAAALSRFRDRLVQRAPEDRPFQAPEYWASFAHVGP